MVFEPENTYCAGETDVEIVTAADTKFFYHALWLAGTINQQYPRPPIKLIDLGLKEVERWRLGQLGVRLVSLSELPADVRKLPRGHVWQTWLKPFYFDFAATRSRVLWLDADVLVLRELKVAMDAIAEKPLLFEDPTEITRLPADVYQILPTPAGYSPTLKVNAGICGFDLTRDRDLLDRWRDTIRWALRAPEKQRDKFTFWDQGALLYAIQYCQLADCVRPIGRWYASADLLDFPMLGADIAKGLSVFQMLAAALPRYRFMHFLGPVKLAERMLDDISNLHFFPKGSSDA